MRRGATMVSVAGAACVVAAAWLWSAGCGNAEPPAVERPAWLVTAEPAGAVDVADAKRTASEGDRVVLRGLIGGRKDAMSAGSAMFVLVDARLHNPCTAGDDHCPTPWDYCCTPGDELRPNLATVQVVDDAGAPVAAELARLGLSPLDAVVVEGTVGPRPTGDVLTINAAAIYRAGE